MVAWNEENVISVYLFNNVIDPSRYYVTMQNREKKTCKSERRKHNDVFNLEHIQTGSKRTALENKHTSWHFWFHFGMLMPCIVPYAYLIL